MSVPHAVLWRQVRLHDAAAMSAFGSGEAEVDEMARNLLVQCHRAVCDRVGPWASFVLEREDNGDIVAIAAIEQRQLAAPLFRHEATYIPVLAVATMYQGLGYSKLLIDAVLTEAAEQRGQYVWAEVSEVNRAAQTLFARNGFECCPVRKQVVPNATHAMWVREK